MKLLIKDWTTFQGKTVTRDTIEHQHLSNIYWYFTIVFGLTREELSDVLTVCSERFNGQILEYKPHIDFIGEIKELCRLDCLVEAHDHVDRYLIRWHGKVVGYIQHPDIKSIVDTANVFR